MEGFLDALSDRAENAVKAVFGGDELGSDLVVLNCGFEGLELGEVVVVRLEPLVAHLVEFLGFALPRFVGLLGVLIAEEGVDFPACFGEIGIVEDGLAEVDGFVIDGG